MEILAVASIIVFVVLFGAKLLKVTSGNIE